MLIITRHSALVQYLRETGIIGDDATIIEHVADPSILDGQDVIGVLPLSLASRCRTITEVPLTLTPADRGVELTIERIREIARPPQTWVVREARVFYW
jgi:putative CRISPR-associated protein (TIGR02620 family)